MTSKLNSYNRIPIYLIVQAAKRTNAEKSNIQTCFFQKENFYHMCPEKIEEFLENITQLLKGQVKLDF